MSDGEENNITPPTDDTNNITTTDNTDENSPPLEVLGEQLEAQLYLSDTDEEHDDEADADVDADADAEEEEEEDEEVIEDASIPSELEELLNHLEDYTPTVPEPLTVHVLKTTGLDSVDPRIVRIMSVAAQKFISDITNNALQYCKTRTTNQQHSNNGANKPDKKNPKDRKYVLAVEDLVPALAEHNITVRKPQYFV